MHTSRLPVRISPEEAQQTFQLYLKRINQSWVHEKTKADPQITIMKTIYLPFYAVRSRNQWMIDARAQLVLDVIPDPSAQKTKDRSFDNKDKKSTSLLDPLRNRLNSLIRTKSYQGFTRPFHFRVSTDTVHFVSALAGKDADQFADVPLLMDFESLEWDAASATLDHVESTGLEFAQPSFALIKPALVQQASERNSRTLQMAQRTAESIIRQAFEELTSYVTVKRSRIMARLADTPSQRNTIEQQDGFLAALKREYHLRRQAGQSSSSQSASSAEPKSSKLTPRSSSQLPKTTQVAALAIPFHVLPIHTNETGGDTQTTSWLLMNAYNGRIIHRHRPLLAVRTGFAIGTATTTLLAPLLLPFSAQLQLSGSGILPPWTTTSMELPTWLTSLLTSEGMTGFPIVSTLSLAAAWIGCSVLPALWFHHINQQIRQSRKQDTLFRHMYACTASTPLEPTSLIPLTTPPISSSAPLASTHSAPSLQSSLSSNVCQENIMAYWEQTLSAWNRAQYEDLNRRHVPCHQLQEAFLGSSLAEPSIPQDQEKNIIALNHRKRKGTSPDVTRSLKEALQVLPPHLLEALLSIPDHDTRMKEGVSNGRKTTSADQQEPVTHAEMNRKRSASRQ